VMAAQARVLVHPGRCTLLAALHHVLLLLTTVVPVSSSGTGVFKEQVLLYNRVGKAGSTSLRELLSSICLVKDYKFGGDVALADAVRRLRALPLSGQPCRVLFGHGRYTPPPPGAYYFNLIRQPVARWLSLRDFWFSNHDMWSGRHRTAPNATSCILRAAHGAAAKTCVAAHDFAMSHNFFSREELPSCDVELALSRFELVLTLEHSESMLHHLLSLLIRGAPNRTAAAEDVVRRVRRFESKWRSNGTKVVESKYARTKLDAATEAELVASLRCDAALYDAVS